jgi:TolB protein
MRTGRRILGAAITAMVAAGVMASAATPAVAGYQGANGKIAFSSDRGAGLDFEIWTTDATGDNPTQVTNNAVNDYSPSFGPNGQKVAFVRESDSAGYGDIWTMTPTGGSVERLTSSTAYDDTPAIGPSGARIAFTRYTEAGSGDIWIMNIDGTGLTRLTDTRSLESDPVFAPDGATIAFTCTADRREICTMNVDGGGRTQLTDCAERDCVAPDYSPSGGKIAFAGYCLKDEPCEGSAEIWTISPNGNNKTRLTPVGGWAEYPHFSPDASKIGFSSGGRPQDIGILRVSDGSITTLAATGDDWGSDWQPA